MTKQRHPVVTPSPPSTTPNASAFHKNDNKRTTQQQLRPMTPTTSHKTNYKKKLVGWSLLGMVMMALFWHAWLLLAILAEGNTVPPPTVMDTDTHLDSATLYSSPLGLPPTKKTIIPTSSLVVDILSVASQNRLENLQAQKDIWQSSHVVRHVWNVTELDDWDTACHSTMTMADVLKISRYCRRCYNTKKTNSISNSTMMSTFQQRLVKYFAHEEYLQRHANPVGWLCSQTRPLIGLVQVLEHYTQHTNEKLPDYFIITDDDTYINMDQFQLYFGDNNNSNNQEPMVTAGCLIRFPMTAPSNSNTQPGQGQEDYHFTFPWGGFGTFYNRRALEQLLRPIHCPGPVCDQIRSKNYVGEAQQFRPGMSLVDLTRAYLQARPFSSYPSWKDAGKDGFCFHSDWFQGYLINIYNVSKHNDEMERYQNVKEERLFRYQDSKVYQSTKTGQCLNNFKKRCHADRGAFVCHKLKADGIREMHQLALSSAFSQNKSNNKNNHA